MKLRDYQEKAIDNTLKHFKKSADPAVLVASVGAGKSLINADLCKKFTGIEQRTLTISRQAEIIKQNIDEAWRYELRASAFSASLGVKNIDCPAIMATERTLIKNLDKFKNINPKIIIVDECHMVNYNNKESDYMQIFDFFRQQRTKEQELGNISKNSHLLILGMTGTDFRHRESIIPFSGKGFWKTRTANIKMQYLIDRGFLTPIKYGYDSQQEKSYDLKKFNLKERGEFTDFDQKELQEMAKTINKSEDRTKKIMSEVRRVAEDRNCILITCASVFHCRVVAKCLQGETYEIITSKTNAKNRIAILDEAKKGRVKYLIQIGCLTTGVNIPLIDTVVILRKIGSLTLLEQLMGRGVRMLGEYEKNKGYKKDNCLVLDYTETLLEMAEYLDSRVLDEARLARSIVDNDVIQCPKCSFLNSSRAVRCVNVIDKKRCDFFWISKECLEVWDHGQDGQVIKKTGCGAENSPNTKSCRICKRSLQDPNKALLGTHYTAEDFQKVTDFKMVACKNNSLLIVYQLESKEEIKVFYSPFSANKLNKTIFYGSFIKKHCNGDKKLESLFYSSYSASDLVGLAPLLPKVEAITHRKNAKNINVIRKIKIAT